MALIIRDGQTYCYLYKRVDGKIERWYRGSGTEAIEAQAIVDDNRCEREIARRANADQERARGVERARGERLFSLVSIGLAACGFVRYNRSAWKRRLMSTTPAKITTNAATNRLRDEIRQLIHELVDGNAVDTVRRLQTIASSSPAVFADEVGSDLPKLAHSIAANCTFPGGGQKRDDLIARMHLLAADLAGVDPSPARRLCAETAAFAWAETWALSMVVAGLPIDSRSSQIARRLDASQRRLLRAVRTCSEIETVEARRRRRQTAKVIDVGFRETKGISK
jgi:uncharacterized membrane protein YidH (DUF202 family)